jgi:hypothetical protein
MNSDKLFHNDAGHHDMETDSHDPLDLLDMSEWNSNDNHSLDNFHLDIPDVSPSHSHSQYHAHQQSLNQDRANYLDNSFPSDNTSQQYDNDNNSVLMGSVSGLSVKKSVVPNITTIYEPKFFEIFQAYQQYCLQYEPNLQLIGIGNSHLMTVCLNNLLCFSNWARDINNGLFIRLTLFENPDMRPEVRNGLAMILIYVFAAAIANELRMNGGDNASYVDMFTIVMNGLGIVNKTSLKIYSDPFEFFNFIKVKPF